MKYQKNTLTRTSIIVIFVMLGAMATVWLNIFSNINSHKEVITTYVSWKTPLGALNGNQYWQSYNYQNEKASDRNYLLINKELNLPESPIKIGSQEYMNLTYVSAVEELKNMKMAGIDVMLYDCMPLPKYNPEAPWSFTNVPYANLGMLPIWLKAADKVGIKVGIFVESANQSGDYPKRCVLDSDESVKLLKAVLDKIETYKMHNSLWKINGKPVIMHFATDSVMGIAPDKMAPAPDGGWRDIIKTLRKNRDFYFIADIRTHTPNREVWKDVADAVYDFSPAGPDHYSADTGIFMKEYFDKLNVPYIFSVSPGYYNRKVYTEPDFNRIHDTYLAAIKSNASKIHIMTWNDTAEDTDIAPTINKGNCLVNVFSYYNNWFKSGKQPAIVKENIILAYPKFISQQVTSNALKWGNGRWVGRSYSPRIFYWATLKSPRTVSILGAGTIDLPAGISMGEFPKMMTICDKLEVNVGGKIQTYPGIKPLEKERLNFQYVNLIDHHAGTSAIKCRGIDLKP